MPTFFKTSFSVLLPCRAFFVVFKRGPFHQAISPLAAVRAVNTAWSTRLRFTLAFLQLLSHFCFLFLSELAHIMLLPAQSRQHGPHILLYLQLLPHFRVCFNKSLLTSCCCLRSRDSMVDEQRRGQGCGAGLPCVPRQRQRQQYLWPLLLGAHPRQLQPGCTGAAQRAQLLLHSHGAGLSCILELYNAVSTSSRRGVGRQSGGAFTGLAFPALCPVFPTLCLVSPPSALVLRPLRSVPDRCVVYLTRCVVFPALGPWCSQATLLHSSNRTFKWDRHTSSNI